MNDRAYEDFDLLFERIPANGHDVYRVRLLNSPEGQTKVEFGKYYSSQQWEELKASSAAWAAFDQADPFVFTDDPSVVRQSSLPLTELGKLLFTNVFHGSLLLCFMKSINKVTQKNLGLRILLRLNEVPELADLPWEYLYSSPPYEYFNLSTHTPIVRYLDLPHNDNTIVPIAENLRILVIVPQPQDLQKLDISQEWDKLQDALDDPQTQVHVELERLELNTLEGLHHRLQQNDKPIHILHFMGHGVYDRERSEGILYFETANGISDPVTANRLTTILKDHSSLQLIFLNSCQGAQSGEKDIFSGTAQNLFRNLHSNLVAVIAMQSQVTDQTAIILANTFYRVLATGYPITSALTEARKTVASSNNDEWGAPVLFMRAYDGIFFDTPISTQQFGFRKLDLENNSEQIDPKTSGKLLQLLCDNQLLILSGEPQVTMYTLAHQIVYELRNKEPNLSVWEWQQEPEHLNFSSLFPLYDKFNRTPDNNIFIIPEVSHDLFESRFLTKLAPLLATRQQYLILITTTSRNTLDLNETISRSWAAPEKTIYRAKYLLAELEKRLQRNAKRLPENLLERLKTGPSELGYSLSKIATQLRLPVRMDTFVERLCNQEVHITKEHIQEWIHIAKDEHDKDRVKYLYLHLRQRNEQLLVVGLCLFGGITETQFFQLLERVIKSNWQYAFTEVEILDYYHLHNLNQFFKYDPKEPQSYPVERTILPQYTNQWWHLLIIIWDSHRNHVRKIFTELAAITTDSISERREEYGDEQQRKQLRMALGIVYSNIGRLSLPAIEDTLLDLASHKDRSIQAVVAGAIARWYDKNEKGDARDQMFKLLQRWLSKDWNQESNWKYQQRNQRYVRYTLARTINQILDKTPDPLPDPLPDLLLQILESHYTVQNFFSTNIARKIFPRHTPYLIECWRKTWAQSAKVETALRWLQVIEIIAPLCKRYKQLPLIASWLVDILAHSIKQHGDSVITLLQENRYLIKEIFPAHLSKLNEDGTLLYLAHSGNFEKEILDVLLAVYRNHPRSVQLIVWQWRQQWIPHLEQINELEDQSWYEVLCVIGKFYSDIAEFGRFKAWLPSLIEEDDSNTQSQIVNIFHRIDSHQCKNLNNTQTDKAAPPFMASGIMEIADEWLGDEQKGAAFHLIVFWFSAKILDEIDRRSIHRNTQVSFYRRKFVPFLVSPWNRRCRIIIGNLLPVVDGLFQDKPDEITRIVRSWQRSSVTHVKQVAQHLAWALYICQAGRTLRAFFSKTRKAK